MFSNSSYLRDKIETYIVLKLFSIKVNYENWYIYENFKNTPILMNGSLKWTHKVFFFSATSK